MKRLLPILLLLAWPALAEDIGDKTTGWSTTAANNNAAAPDGWPENMAPSAVNNAARENMRAVRKWFNDAQWIEYGDGDGAYTVTWVASTQFKIEGVDVSSVYHVGRRVKLVNTTEGTVYGTITAVSFSTDTTVTVASFNLTNEAITSVELGILTQTNSSFPRVADLSDADGDTLVQLEEGADDDTFRVDAGGTGDMLTVAANAITFGGGTQDYIWSKRGNTALAVQGQTSGQAVLLDLFSADGDGTDDVSISLYNQGTPSDTNNPERLTIEYDASLEYAEIFTFAGGTGTLHPLRLFTGLDNDQLVLSTTGAVFVGDTANGNMTGEGLTVAGSGTDDQIFAIKDSDIATVLSTAVFGADVETDDVFTVEKFSAANGGSYFKTMGNSSLATHGIWETYGGAPATTDTTTSLGAMNFFVAQHDGNDTLQDMATDSNAFVWGEIDSGARTARMILKADDGELHLGNATPVALDYEDDVAALRGLQRVTTNDNGIVETIFDTGHKYDHAALERIGMVGPKDENGEFLIKVQPILGGLMGAAWQQHLRHQVLLSLLERHNPGLVAEYAATVRSMGLTGPHQSVLAAVE